MVRDTARDYAQEKLFPRVLAANRDGDYNPAIIREMGALGLLGSTIPEEYGGAGLGYVCYGLIAREIERVDSGFRSLMSVQSSLVMHPIYAYGSEAQRRKYLPKLASGEMVGCFGLTEPDHGSDPGSMVTRAEKVAGGYQPQRRQDVDHQCAGRRRGRGLGQARRQDPRLHRRARHQGFLDAEDRRQAVAARLDHRRDRARRRRGAGRKHPAQRRRPCRPVRLSQRRAQRHRLGRDGGGGILLAPRPRLRAQPQAIRPAARRQSAGPEEARRHADRDHARPARCAAAVAHDRRGKASPPAISLLKRNNCGKALEVARLARDMHGGNGIAEEFHVMRVLCNLETVNTYEGTHDIHALVLGRAQTGIQAFM